MCFLLLSNFISAPVFAQLNSANSIQKAESVSAKTLSFPEKCLGVWEGTMFLYKYNNIHDSVQVTFTAARTENDSLFIWKTEYHSSTIEVVKDYKLKLDDSEKGRYILDEGDGIQLIEYNVGNKLYCMFKLDDTYFTSSTELIGENLVFEVTSGKEENETQGIQNFSFTNVQRVVLTRVR